MKLDFGGIGQGFAADECLKILREKHGIRHALADAGGDIALGDAPPGERGWRIEIPAPDSQRTTLFLKNCGITTSGATYRFFEVGGTRYSHIIDPRTGWGVPDRSSVTIIAPTGLAADALATAASVLGPEQGGRLVESIDGAAGYFVVATDARSTEGRRVECHETTPFRPYTQQSGD